jgi:hypothetical protein
MNMGDYLEPTGGLFTANHPLFILIEFAYKLSLAPEQEKALPDSLPKRASAQMFRCSPYTLGEHRVIRRKINIALMKQSLLAKRFKLVYPLSKKRFQFSPLHSLRPEPWGLDSVHIAAAHHVTSPLLRVALYLLLIPELQRVATTASHSIVENSTSWSGRTTWY